MKRFYLENTKEYISWLKQDSAVTARILTIADYACENTFIFTDKYEMERCTTPVRFDGKIDWNHIPFGDNEWCFAFNRHTFLLNLAKAYAITEDEKYREAWLRLFNDFYENTAPEGNNRSLCWRSLESGIRIENYIRSLEFFEDTKPVYEGIKERIDDFFRTHISYLLETHDAFHRLSNWGVLQDHGLFLAAAWLDDRESAKTALSRLAEEAVLQTMDDGIHWEQSPMYQAEVLHACLDSILVARRLSYEIPDELMDKTHLLADGLGRINRPDGKCPLFGDSDEIDMKDMILEAAVIFNDGQLAGMGHGGADHDFYASFPLDQKIPEELVIADRTRVFSDTGNAILAMSPETEVRFHCGLIGSGHGHLDQLHFDLYHKGQMLLTDTGRYTYVDSEQRRALKGSYGHNTLIINGMEMSEMADSWVVNDFAEPACFEAKCEGPFKYVSAAHLGYLSQGAFVKRTIITLDDSFIVIADTVQSDRKCGVTRLFHLDEGCDLTRDGNTFMVKKEKACARLFFLSGETLSVSKGMMSKHYNEMLEADVISAKTDCSGSLICMTVIALKEGASAKPADVVKPLTGTVFDRNTATGLVLKADNDRYIVSFASREVPSKGFLSSCEGADSYARVFVRKNDEPVKVLKF